MLDRWLIRGDNWWLSNLFIFRRNQSQKLLHVLSFHKVVSHQGLCVEDFFWEVKLARFDFVFSIVSRTHATLVLDLGLWRQKAWPIKADCRLLIFWLDSRGRQLVCEDLYEGFSWLGKSFYWLRLALGKALVHFLHFRRRIIALIKVRFLTLPEAFYLTDVVAV